MTLPEIRSEKTCRDAKTLASPAACGEAGAGELDETALATVVGGSLSEACSKGKHIPEVVIE